MTNTGFFIPLIPAAGIALFIFSAVRKGQIDLSFWHGLSATTVSCYRSRTPGNFWLFIGAAGIVGLALAGLAAFLALAGSSD